MKYWGDRACPRLIIAEIFPMTALSNSGSNFLMGYIIGPSSSCLS